jgi:hypothetical protein
MYTDPGWIHHSIFGLAHLSISSDTDHERDNIPQVTLTSELEWDPPVLDHDFK